MYQVQGVERDRSEECSEVEHYEDRTKHITLEDHELGR
jgi:hypothetical protein